MKTKEITSELVEKLTTAPNREYVVWANGDEITADELRNEFHLTIYDNKQINVEHDNHDYRIENVEL